MNISRVLLLLLPLFTLRAIAYPGSTDLTFYPINFFYLILGVLFILLEFFLPSFGLLFVLGAIFTLPLLLPIFGGPIFIITPIMLLFMGIIPLALFSYLYFRQNKTIGTSSLTLENIGKEATVLQLIAYSKNLYHIQIQGEIWRAKGPEGLTPHQKVLISTLDLADNQYEIRPLEK